MVRVRVFYSAVILQYKIGSYSHTDDKGLKKKRNKNKEIRKLLTDPRIFY